MGEIQRHSDQQSRDSSPISNTLPAKYVYNLFLFCLKRIFIIYVYVRTILHKALINLMDHKHFVKFYSFCNANSIHQKFLVLLPFVKICC